MLKGTYLIVEEKYRDKEEKQAQSHCTGGFSIDADGIPIYYKLFPGNTHYFILYYC